MEIEYIIKRDYSTKAFHLEKISGAIHKATCRCSRYTLPAPVYSYRHNQVCTTFHRFTESTNHRISVHGLYSAACHLRPWSVT